MNPAQILTRVAGEGDHTKCGGGGFPCIEPGRAPSTASREDRI